MTECVEERMIECLESSVYTLQIMGYNYMILHLAYVYNIFVWILLIFSGLVTGLQNFRKGKMCIVGWFAGRKFKDHSCYNYSLNLKKYIYIYYKNAILNFYINCFITTKIIILIKSRFS